MATNIIERDPTLSTGDHKLAEQQIDSAATLLVDNAGSNAELPQESANFPSRYEVLSRVGNGGMGIVHKVRDRETDEIIALKILKPEIAEDPAMQENLRKEVCLARKVTHKNVCRIHEFNRSNGAVFISMEFVDGESLLSRLQRTGPLSWEEVVPSALQICAGLREAHIQGIVHRDLKPANIMVDLAGNLKVMDFGIARQSQGTGQLTATMVGTPAYMAPEQLELRRIDARTDIYALGLLLYEMTTGLQAFTGETPIAVALKQLTDIPKRPRELMPTLPAHAEAAILKCLQKEPAKRFQSVDELMMALKRKAIQRPATSLWNSFVVDARRAKHDLQLDFQFAIKTVEEYLRSKDWNGYWRALTTRSAKKTLAIGLGVACLLAALVTVAVNVKSKSRVARPFLAASPVMEDHQNLVPSKSAAPAAINTSASVGQKSNSEPGNVSRTAPTPSIGSFQVDLEMPSDPATEKNPVAATKSSASSTNAVPTPGSKVTSVKPNAKVQPSTQVSTSSAHAVRASSSAATTAVNQPAQSLAVSLESTADASEPSKSKPDNTVVEPVTSDAAPAHAETIGSEKVSSTAATPAAFETPYLEVGSFKDSTWADQAVDKLAELGFHSTCIHKTHLWMQSYQVRVGPYASQKDLDDARKNLASLGFKTHPVK